MPKRGHRGTKDKLKRKRKLQVEHKKQEMRKERQARQVEVTKERERLIAQIRKNTRYARKYSRIGVAKSKGGFFVDHERAYRRRYSFRPGQGSSPYAQDNIVIVLVPSEKTFDQYDTERLRRLTYINDWESFEELGPLEKLAIAADD